MADEPRGLDTLFERFTYANASARTSAGPFFNQDVGKIGYQQDTGVYYRLTAINPVAWVTLPPDTGAVAHQFATSMVGGQLVLAQPAFSDISGTVAATQLPNPSATTLG